MFKWFNWIRVMTDRCGKVAATKYKKIKKKIRSGFFRIHFFMFLNTNFLNYQYKYVVISRYLFKWPRELTPNDPHFLTFYVEPKKWSTFRFSISRTSQPNEKKENNTEKYFLCEYFKRNPKPISFKLPSK